MTVPIVWDLVLPDQVSCRGLLSLNRAARELEALPKEQHRAFRETYLPVAQNHPHPSIRYEVQKAIEGDPRATTRLALLGAAMASAVTIFVASKVDGHAYEIVLDLWKGACLKSRIRY